MDEQSFNFDKFVAEEVAGCITAVIREAERDADMVVAFLKFQGLAPCKRKKHALDTDAVLYPPAAAFLLGLASAIRLRRWEKAGFPSSLSQTLPSAYHALTVASAASEPSTVEQSRQLSLHVFETTLSRMSCEAARNIGADVVLPDQIVEDALLDTLADFLYRHRQLL